MTIEIHDASLEARIRKQLQATGSSSVEEVLLRLLEVTSTLDPYPRVVTPAPQGVSTSAQTAPRELPDTSSSVPACKRSFDYAVARFATANSVQDDKAIQMAWGLSVDSPHSFPYP